jgi:hypothetical protein
MSDNPADYSDPITMRALLAKIDRDLAESSKLIAEARKFNRDMWIVPLTVFGAILAAAVARLPEILRAFGLGP